MTLEKPRTEAPAAEDHPQAPAEEQPEKKSPALNIPGLLAGAATAATMSVIGGHLSVVGTVLGAALTSIVSGIAIVLYSASLEKSRRGAAADGGASRPDGPGAGQRRRLLGRRGG